MFSLGVNSSNEDHTSFNMNNNLAEKMEEAASTAESPDISGRSIPSSQVSLYSLGDKRRQTQEDILRLRGQATSQHIHREAVREGYVHMATDEGVIVKCFKDNFTCWPEDLAEDRNRTLFYRTMCTFNSKIAMTVRTPVVESLLQFFRVGDNVRIHKDRSIQVLAGFEDILNCKRHHYGAFIKNEGMLVVWEDDPGAILERANDIQRDLVGYLWNRHEKEEENGTPSESQVDLTQPQHDSEDGSPAPRPIPLTNCFIIAFVLVFLLGTLSLGWRNMAYETAVDGNWTRMWLLVFTPAQAWLSIFFMCTLICNILQIFGGCGNLHLNSKFYSAKKPIRLTNPEITPFPHVTIQMPVYKEGLEGVIKPTVKSLKAAVSTYEQQGGSANIFICDDGMQLIPEHEAEARKEFYAENSIGWVSRPGHNPEGNGNGPIFNRKGKFKKASNMNYALQISNKVEDKLVLVQRGRDWTSKDESAEYNRCLEEVLVENPLAQAMGNIRMGDYVLLVDSDTRIPEDCLLDATSEMEKDPEVGIMQFSSGVMLVSDSFFEKGVKYFTDLIYSAIRYCVAQGDLSPFVGHNAILRWSAMQQVVYNDEDVYDKFWSESHVSEDFDMSLRLQCIGYTIRLAAYFGEEFKEGVSLTVYDELARWEKYAFGCNELLFHPLIQWPRRGVFTPLFKKWLWSPIRFSSKIGIMGYIGTYYAIGAAWILTFVNYFLVGWVGGHLDKYYLDSFRIILSLFVVFTMGGNVALAVFRYRSGQSGILSAFILNFTWLPLLTIFLGGLSVHVSQALVSHFIGYDMQWGATAKEIEGDADIWEELGKVFKRFKWTFAYATLAIIMMIFLSGAIPAATPSWLRPDWQIKEFIAWFPMATIIGGHVLMPIVLNPGLMRLSY